MNDGEMNDEADKTHPEAVEAEDHKSQEEDESRDTRNNRGRQR